MDYKEHLKKYKDKTDTDLAARKQREQDHQNEIKEAAKQAENIINQIIYPELDKLHRAVLDMGFPSDLEIKRLKVYSIDTEYSIKIELRLNVGNYLTFEAKPENGQIHITTRKNQGPPATEKFQYGFISSKFVENRCAEFVESAFKI